MSDDEFAGQRWRVVRVTEGTRAAPYRVQKWTVLDGQAPDQDLRYNRKWYPSYEEAATAARRKNGTYRAYLRQRARGQADGAEILE